VLLPEVDIAACSLCLGCVEICPDVFRVSEAAGHIEVMEMAAYPVELVDEAIKNCPEDCISWQPA